MSKKIIVDDSQVFTVYSWFRSAMRGAGRKIDFPKCSDKTKTYPFRWTKKFVERCEALDLSEEIIRHLVYDIVDYAKRQKLLDKGTQLLCMNNVIDICHQSIEQMVDDDTSLIREVRSCHEFVCDQADHKNNLVRLLVAPVSEGGYSNLVYWYNLGHITDVYLALSKKCNKALSKIPQDERLGLPSQIELLRLCTYAVSKDLIATLESVMGTDLRIPPTILTR